MHLSLLRARLPVCRLCLRAKTLGKLADNALARRCPALDRYAITAAVWLFIGLGAYGDSTQAASRVLLFELGRVTRRVVRLD